MTQTRALSDTFSLLLSCFLAAATASALAFPQPAFAQGAQPAPPSQPAPPKESAAPASPPSTTAPKPPAATSDSDPKAAPPPDTAEAAPPASAPTEEQKAAAQAQLEQGEAAYKAGDYARAVAHFQQSNQLAPSPQAQFWLAQSLDLQGDAARAIEAFEALFANPAHTQLPPEQLEPARNRLSILKQIPATLSLQVSPADAELLVDGQPQPGTSPFALKLPAGVHRILLQKEGFEPLEFDVEVRAAEALEQTLELTQKEAPAAPPLVTETPAPPAPESPPPEPQSKVPAYITLGVAGASAVVGTIFGIQALNAKSDFDDNPTASNADTVERNALIADMAFGVAFTLGITGVVLLTADEPEEVANEPASRERGSVAITPYVSPQGGGAAAWLSF